MVSGVAHAHLRVHLQRMPSAIRGPGLRKREGRVPEVPRHQAGTTAFGLRGFSKKFIGLGVADRRLRILRRSSRARRLLTRRHELGKLRLSIVRENTRSLDCAELLKNRNSAPLGMTERKLIRDSPGTGDETDGGFAFLVRPWDFALPGRASCAYSCSHRLTGSESRLGHGLAVQTPL